MIDPRVQFTATAFDFYSIDTEEVINSITVDAKGGAVAINFGFDKLTATVNSRGGDPTVYLRLRRNGTWLRTIEFKETMPLVNLVNNSIENIMNETIDFEAYSILIFQEIEKEAKKRKTAIQAGT